VAIFRPISARHDNLLTNGRMTFGVIQLSVCHFPSRIFVSFYIFSMFLASQVSFSKEGGCDGIFSVTFS
jgi:hypothetical protein